MGKSCHRVATTMHIPFFKRSGNRGRKQGLNNSRKTRRLGCFEALESRQLLSITLPTISNVSLPAGTTMYVPLSGSAAAGQTLKYSVTSSDYSDLTPVVMPASNKTLELDVSVNGTTEAMDFQLFDNLAPVTTAAIEALVNSGFFNGLQIYRNSTTTTNGVTTTFCIQGGNMPPSWDLPASTPSGQTSIKTQQPSELADEFNPDLQFTSGGMLAMARLSSPDTGSSEFFITGEATRSLDFSYSIFGIQTTGFDVFSQIAALPDTTDATKDPSNLGYLNVPVTITSASLITSQTGVLQLSAPVGATGTATVTVTASDAADAAATQTFTVTVGPDTTSSPPANPFKAAIPATPTIAYVPASGASSTTTALNNSTSASALNFAVTGVTSGDVVEILCDGNVIGKGTATGTSITVPTDGLTTLTDGAHTFTAIQIATSRTVVVTEKGSSSPETKTADVPGFNSLGVQLSVDTTPQFNFPQAVTAVLRVPYTCQVSVTGGTNAGVVYALTDPKPSGMAIDPNTGMITWTPTDNSVVGTPQVVNLQATNASGKTVSQQYSINVLASNAAPVLTAKTPSLGTTESSTATTIALTAFINGDSGTTTQITDADTNPVLGGIAIVGTTGSGSWSYILSGSTTPVAIGSVSASSALLLPHDASLYYMPNGTPETATIIYHAWDTTGGAATGRVDLSQSSLGGSTAYSTATDTASLTVVNSCSVSGFVYLDVGGALARTGIQGVAITLYNTASGVWTAMTGADGSYHFSSLAAGTYRMVEAIPDCYVSGMDAIGQINGNADAEAIHTQKQFANIRLPAESDATDYDFRAIGIQAEYIASWMFMASAPQTVAAVLAQMDVAPSVDLAKSAAGSGFSATYEAASPAVNIAAADAAITDSDSPYLASMTATIANPRDGAAEKLAATTTGTQITAAYSGGVLTLSGVDTTSNYQTVLRSIVYSDTASTAGDRTINVVVNDGIATSQAATAVLSVTPDTTAPSNYSIIAKDANINATTAKATGFVFAGAEVGATYTYKITSSASTTASLTNSGTITSATQVIGNIDVSSLPDGTLTYDVYLTDEANNNGSHVQATALLDRVATTAFTVAPTLSVINFSEKTAAGFTISGGGQATTYTYTITSDGAGTYQPISQTGAFSPSAPTFNNINVSTLPDGKLTFTVTLTDAAGDSTTQTATATLDTVAPSGYSIAAKDPTLNAASDTTKTGFTFTGAEVGATYNYKITSDQGGEKDGSGLVGSDQSVTVDVTSLSDGNLTYDVYLTDAAGNAGSHVQATAWLDRIPPVPFTVAPTDLTIGLSKASSTGFTISNGEDLTNCTYTVTSINGSTTGIPVTGSGHFSSSSASRLAFSNIINVSSLRDGLLTFTVTLTDKAGNSTTETATATLNSTLP